MPLPHLAPEVDLAVLIRLKLKNGQIYRYQNYSRDTIRYEDGFDYEFLPIVYQGVSRSMELDSTPAELRIPNNSVTRAIVYQNAGLRKASIEVRRIFPSRADAVPIVDRVMVMQVSFSYAEITLSLGSPLSAIGGQIPSSFFTSKKFPFLPTNTRTSL